MSVAKGITLHLDGEAYNHLAAEAARLGMRPSSLAEAYVRSGLASREATVESRRRAVLAALDRLEAFRADLRRAGYPSVDAVQLMRESRDELERRNAAGLGFPVRLVGS